MTWSIGPDDLLPVIPAGFPLRPAVDESELAADGHVHTSGLAGERTNVLPLAPLHLKAGWHPAPVHGWTLPLWYGGLYDEQQAARDSAVIWDRSVQGRFYVTGEGAAEVLARVFATDARRVPPRTVARLVACREDGTVLDIATACHLDAGRWLLLTGPRGQVRLREAVAAAVRSGEDVVVRDRMLESVLLAVAGPRAAEHLEHVAGHIPHAVPRGEAHEVLLGGWRALVAHTAEVGEETFWFLVSPEVGEHLWENALTAGIVPAGLAAWDTMRVEAGVIEAPSETPAPATPYHAGLGDLVDLDGPEGPRAFPGAAALRALRAAGVERVLRGLRMDGPRLAKRGSRVSVPAGDLGACVAGMFSPALGTGIALAYLPPDLRRVTVDTDGVPQPADVVNLPFVRGPRGALGA